MSARNYIETFAAGEAKRFPAGRFFFVKTAAAAIDIQTEGNPGAPVQFTGIGAGSKYGPLPEGQGWRFLRVTSASVQNVEIVISDDGDFDVANTVSIVGAAATVEVPSTALATPAADVIATASALAIAANASRRRITLCALSTNTGSVFVQANGAGAGRGIELQSGLFVELKTTAAIDVRNDTGANQTIMRFEET